MPVPDRTHTQALSREIDAAYEDYCAGKPGREERLYRAFKAQAANVLWHRLESSEEALAHDISTRAMLAVDGFKGHSRLSTWFYRIAQNEAKDALRSRIENRQRSLQLDVEALEDDASPLLPLLAARPANLDVPMDIDKLQEGLPPEQTAVVAALVEGHSLEEFAEKVGVPKGTIRGRYRLAKEKMRKKRKK